MERAYQEVIEFIAGGTTPQNVVAFRPAEAAKARVESLIAQKKSGGLSADFGPDLEAAYRDMASDEAREAEALEWAEATIGDCK